MARTYILSDLHFGVRGNSIAVKDMMLEYFDWFLDDAKKNGMTKDDNLIILGDVYHSRESVNFMILKTVFQLFTKLSKEFNTITVLAGNHDCYYVTNNDITSINLLQTLSDNIKCIEHPEVMEISGKKCLMLAWEHNFDEVSRIISEDSSEYLFCHMDIDGMKYAAGTSIKNSANREMLNKYKHVYSGHIHIRQENGNVTYVGSPYHLDLGDSGNEKGYYYLDEDFNSHFFKNTVSPIYQYITIDQILNANIDEAKALLDNTYSYIKCSRNIFANGNLLQFRNKLSDLGINFKKLDFYQEYTGNDDVNTETYTMCEKFDVFDETRDMLVKKMKKTDSEIDARLDYMKYLHKKIQDDENSI